MKDPNRDRFLQAASYLACTVKQVPWSSILLFCIDNQAHWSKQLTFPYYVPIIYCYLDLHGSHKVKSYHYIWAQQTKHFVPAQPALCHSQTFGNNKQFELEYEWFRGACLYEKPHGFNILFLVLLQFFVKWEMMLFQGRWEICMLWNFCYEPVESSRSQLCWTACLHTNQKLWHTSTGSSSV